jgi:glutamate racemase
MLDKQSPIGIIDSGIGGYSVARRMQSLLPHEDFLYLGDGANTPYGNHSAPEILSMTRRLLRFMEVRRVKALVIACNTISCVAEQLSGALECPVLNVLHSGAQAAARLELERVGVISTCFTAQSGCYGERIRRLSPGTQVISRGCPDLAELIERYIDQPGGEVLIDRAIQESLAGLEEVRHLLLACTHYPLAEDRFRRLYPDRVWIDPAKELAACVKHFLAENNLLNPSPGLGHMEICTTGSARDYARKAEKAGLRQITCVRHLAV